MRIRNQSTSFIMSLIMTYCFSAVLVNHILAVRLAGCWLLCVCLTPSFAPPVGSWTRLTSLGCVCAGCSCHSACSVGVARLKTRAGRLGR